MRKSRATDIVGRTLGLSPGRCLSQVQAASDAGLLPKATGKQHMSLTSKQLVSLFLAIIADRGVAQTPQSVVTFGTLADANGNTLAQTLEAMFAGRLPVTDSDDLVLSLQPPESATLGARRYGSTLPSSAAARVVAIPARSLAAIAADFRGRDGLGAWPPTLHTNIAHAITRR